MGGDDLGSDDEYLKASGAPLSGDASSSDDEINNDEVVKASTKSNNTKREAASSTKDKARSSKKRRTRESGTEDLRNYDSLQLRTKDCAEQARLLSGFADVTFHPRQLTVSSNADSPHLTSRLEGIVSKKKIKTTYGHKGTGSPCILIICMSALRAVSVLKEIAPLNIRAVKLFAKHLKVEDQVKQLQAANASYGVAVGTPHRILTLAQRGALSLEHTRAVMLDSFRDNKKFSVYTLPDTVPHTKEFLVQFVQPECQKRKDLRLAFL